MTCQVRSFKCPYCSRTFNSERIFTRHLLRVHKIQNKSTQREILALQGYVAKNRQRRSDEKLTVKRFYHLSNEASNLIDQLHLICGKGKSEIVSESILIACHLKLMFPEVLNDIKQSMNKNNKKRVG